jgi:hypothetical protein
MKKFILFNLLISFMFIANALNNYQSSKICRFKIGDAVMITHYDLDPALVGQTGTILTNCNDEEYYYVNLPHAGGTYTVKDEDLGLAE